MTVRGTRFPGPDRVSPVPTPVLYLDLDGTVREGYETTGEFNDDPSKVKILDGVIEQMEAWREERAGRIVAVSNQGGIALGHTTPEKVAAVMMRTQQLVGGLFDLMLWCSHHPDADTPEWSRCWCRKPRIGLIVEGALTLGEKHRHEMYPPHLAMVVGDLQDDADLALNANITFIEAKYWRAGGWRSP